jgi:hypothetical protein
VFITDWCEPLPAPVTVGETTGDGVTVAVGDPESDVSTVAPAADTVSEAPDWRIYYPAEEGDS